MKSFRTRTKQGIFQHIAKLTKLIKIVPDWPGICAKIDFIKNEQKFLETQILKEYISNKRTLIITAEFIQCNIQALICVKCQILIHLQSFVVQL